MKRAFVVASLLVAACRGADSQGFQRPAGHVAVSFSVDDRANRAYADGQLGWKGSMRYDEATRIAVNDQRWMGPWARLYDDGPWDAGGHERPGAVAGDHVFGTTVFVKPPANEAELYQGFGFFHYGLIDIEYDQREGGNGWMWKGEDGGFAVALRQTADVVLDTYALPKWGDIDLRLTLDTAQLEARMDPWDTSTVAVKSSAWMWGPVVLKRPGDPAAADGVYAAVLSERTGPQTADFTRVGKLSCSFDPFELVEFVWVLGTEEYKDDAWNARAGGTAAAIQRPEQAWEPRPIERATSGDFGRNTGVTIPCTTGAAAGASLLQ